MKDDVRSTGYTADVEDDERKKSSVFVLELVAAGRKYFDYLHEILINPPERLRFRGYGGSRIIDHGVAQ